MRWNVAAARRHFSDLVRASTTEEQSIFQRDHLVAVLICPEEYQKFRDWKDRQGATSLASAFEELRALCQQEDYSFELPERTSRIESWPEVLDELSDRHEHT